MKRILNREENVESEVFQCKKKYQNKEVDACHLWHVPPPGISIVSVTYPSIRRSTFGLQVNVHICHVSPPEKGIDSAVTANRNPPNPNPNPDSPPATWLTPVNPNSTQRLTSNPRWWSTPPTPPLQCGSLLLLFRHVGVRETVTRPPCIGR